MATPVNAIRITRWQNSQHPTLSSITRLMKTENLRPYLWDNTPNYRYGVRSHNYHKILYVISGTLEITLPDSNQTTRLRAGDRVEIPAGVRHGMLVGVNGVQCAEAAIATPLAQR